jgi:signal transduction histidine kinase
VKKNARRTILRRNSSNSISKKLEVISALRLDKYFVSFEIRIKDSGRGIAKENQDGIFLNFSKLADEEGTNKTGTGLGLSVCKHIVEKMGGEVKVES